MCDSSLERSAGWSEGEFYSKEYPPSLTKDLRLHINELECITVTACVKLWSEKCKGKKLLLYCDNKATVLAVNTGRSKNRFMQACLRELHHVCSLSSCELRLKYIKMADNRIPDFLSRLHKGPKYKKRFEELTKGLETKELKVPDTIFEFEFMTL